MKQNPRKDFQENIDHYENLTDKVSAKFAVFSWVRVLVFLLSTFSVGYLFYLREILFSGISLVLGFIVFGIIVRLHRQIAFQRRQSELLLEINGEELRKLDLELSGLYQGDEYKDEHHAYASDLDLFGRSSLFQLLNRTATPTGQEKLAKWLQDGADKETIVERQGAVQVLVQKTKWRQNFQALSRHLLDEKGVERLKALRKWLSHELDSGILLNRNVALLVAAINFAITATVVLGGFPVEYIIVPALVGIYMIRKLQPEIQEATEVSFQSVKLLRSYVYLIRSINHEDFDNDNLNSLKKVFIQPQPALKEIGRLAGLMEFLNNRANMLYWVFNGLFLIDVHLINGINKWKQQNADKLGEWIDTVSQFEALNGLAGFAYANPGYAVPNVSTDGLSLKSNGLGHPLIPTEQRVTNDFQFENNRIGIITGSNMSGKSTFLRTVGLNLVLAQSGSVVCADFFEFTPITLFSSMRTSDNLEESVSSFYAELKRIERLLHLVEHQQPVFFLLDEILKGTNTHDRQLGARSLIKQLNKKPCLGFVSTHDLALGELGEKEDQLVNLNFSSEVINGELKFDYKLRSGVCQSFNASELMAQIGIELEK